VCGTLTELAEQLNAERGEDEEEEEEEQAEVAHLRQRLPDRVEERANALGHLEQLEHARYAKHAHHADDGGVDGQLERLELLKDDAGDREDDDGRVELVPSLLEVAPNAERHHPGDHLQREDGREEVVERPQRVHEHGRHEVELERHRDDVHADDGRDRQVKVLGGDDIEQEASMSSIRSPVLAIAPRLLCKRVPSVTAGCDDMHARPILAVVH